MNRRPTLQEQCEQVAADLRLIRLHVLNAFARALLKILRRVR